MKANEIIAEAPAIVDKIAGGLAGWKAGGQQNAGVKANQAKIDQMVNKWQQTAGQIKASSNTPATPEQFANFLKTQFPYVDTAKFPADPANANAVKDAIAKVIHQQSVNRSTGTGVPLKAGAVQAPATTVPTAAAAMAGQPQAKPTAPTADPVPQDQWTDAFKQATKTGDTKTLDLIAKARQQESGTQQASEPAASEPRTATPTPSQVMQSFRTLSPEEQADTLERLTKAYSGQEAPATAEQPAADPFAAKRAAAAQAAQTDMSANVATPAPAPSVKPVTNFGGAYASPTTNAPVATTPTIQQRPNLGPGKATPEPSSQDLTKQALDARRKQGLMAGKVNKKPSIAEMKKLKNKLIVKEMALAKAKRDKGII